MVPVGGLSRNPCFVPSNATPVMVQRVADMGATSVLVQVVVPTGRTPLLRDTTTTNIPAVAMTMAVGVALEEEAVALEEEVVVVEEEEVVVEEVVEEVVEDEVVGDALLLFELSCQARSEER